MALPYADEVVAGWSPDTRQVVYVLLSWGVSEDRARTIGDALADWRRPLCAWCQGPIDFTKRPGGTRYCSGRCYRRGQRQFRRLQEVTGG
jgi:hypothetical protein